MADVFSEFEHIRERMEQAYRRVIGAPGSPRFCIPIMEPPADVYETDADVVIVVEIAGVSEQEIDLEVEGTTLTLRGERKPIKGRPRRVYSQMEIYDGPFQRDILLPAEVNPDGVRAVYKDGMLEITLPKASAGLSRQLRIVVR